LIRWLGYVEERRRTARCGSEGMKRLAEKGKLRQVSIKPLRYDKIAA
jgi:hypothetical protein